MGNRKAAMVVLLTNIEKLLPGSDNAKMYEQQLGKLSDADFEQYIIRLENGSEVLSLVAPNLSEPKLNLERNLALAEELGHPLFERLWLTDAKTGQTYLTNKRYLVIDLPLRRQQQLLVKKIAIPKDNRHVDELTGQASGDSDAASLSFPELQVLYAQGQDRSIEELIKFRGGDTKAFQALTRSVVETGGASQDAIKTIPTRVKSTETLSVLLKSMHLDNNL